MTRFFIICLGGALGTAARYLLATWVTTKAGKGFPVSTLVVNALGSFAMGYLFQHFSANPVSETTRLALVTGVLGGFTTYSAFNQETLRYFQPGEAWMTGVAYVAVTVLACLGVGAAGMAAARAGG
jgi:CrcB protein